MHSSSMTPSERSSSESCTGARLDRMPSHSSFSAQRFSKSCLQTSGGISSPGVTNDVGTESFYHGALLPPPFSLLPLDPPNTDELYAFIRSSITVEEHRHGNKRSQCCDSSTSSGSRPPVSIRSVSSSQRRSPSLKLSFLSGKSSSSRPSPLTYSPSPSTQHLFPRLRTSSQSSVVASVSQTQISRSTTSLRFTHDLKGKKKEVRGAALSTVSIHTLVETEETAAEKAEEARWKQVQARASEIAATMLAQDKCNAAVVFHDFSEAFEQDLVTTSRIFSSQKGLIGLPNTPNRLGYESDRPSKLASLMTRLSLRNRKKTSVEVSAVAPSQYSLLNIQVPEDDVAPDCNVRAASSLSWSWGCCSRAVWNVRPVAASHDTLDTTCVDAARGRVIDCRDPRLKGWPGFLRLYGQGCLDLSFTPAKPDEERTDNDGRGITHRLEAPTPSWEASRCRTYHRLQIDELDAESLRLISGQVAACSTSLRITRMLLQCLDGETVLRLTISGLEKEAVSRRDSMCAHTILNQNRGLLVENLETDWRFDMSEEGDSLSSYAGMPVLAANGLPVAVLSAWDRNLDLSETAVETLRGAAREIGRIFEAHFCKEWQVKIGRMAVSFKELQEKVGKAVTRQCRSLQHSPSIESRKSSCSSSASQHRPGWSVTYDAESLELLAENGMLVSLEDIERMRYLLGEMSLQIEMEVMYIAAVCSAEGQPSSRRIHLLSTHNLHDGRPSDSFHQLTIFPSEADDEESIDQRYILELCEAHEEYNKVQPIEGYLFRSILVLPLARRGSLKFILGSLTQDREKTIGVEDLRYLQALRPILCGMIDKFQIAFQSAQIEAEYDARRKEQSRQSAKGKEKELPRSEAEIKKQRRRRPVPPLELFLMGATDQAGLKPRPRPRRIRSAPLVNPSQEP